MGVGFFLHFIYIRKKNMLCLGTMYKNMEGGVLQQAPEGVIITDGNFYEGSKGGQNEN